MSIKKTDSIAPVQPKRIDPPIAKKAPPARAHRDELSTGAGRALRTATEKILQANPFSASHLLQTEQAIAHRIDATGKLIQTNATHLIDGGVKALQTGATDLITGGAKLIQGALANLKSAPPDDVKQKAKDDLELVRDADSFSFALRREKDPAVRAEMVAQAIKQYPNFFTGFSQLGNVANQGFDDMTVVANAVADAYATGSITDDDLKNFVKKGDPYLTSELIQDLAISPANTGIGGVVEALGNAAQAAGDKQSAALAFTSSESLITTHLPTAAAQQDAFKQLKSYIDEVKNGVDEPIAVDARNGTELALIAASRLTARGNGASQSDYDALLKDLGPRVVGEAVARDGQIWGDGNVPGPLDTLGKAATHLAGSDGDKHKEEWTLDASIAFTQSPQLIQANLDSNAKKQAAFDSINGYLADHRGDWKDAADGEFGAYSLLRAPEALEGLNRLLTLNPQMIGQMIDSGAKGEADLVQLFESVEFNPNVPKDQRDQLTRTVQSYLDTAIDKAGDDASETGDQVGKLLGLMQVAANRSVSAAKGDEKNEVKGLALDFAKTVVSSVAGSALAPTGPVGSVVGGFIIGKVLDSVFGALGDQDPSADEIRAAFEKQLAAAGIDVSAGEAGRDALTSTFSKALDALNAQLSQATTQADKDNIQKEINLISELKNGIGIEFGAEIDSSDSGGQLGTELDQRKDHPGT